MRIDATTLPSFASVVSSAESEQIVIQHADSALPFCTTVEVNPQAFNAHQQPPSLHVMRSQASRDLASVFVEAADELVTAAYEVRAPSTLTNAPTNCSQDAQELVEQQGKIERELLESKVEDTGTSLYGYTSGKWWVEWRVHAQRAPEMSIGVCAFADALSTPLGSDQSSWGYRASGGVRDTKRIVSNGSTFGIPHTCSHVRLTQST
jgi:hypothetical protein